MDAGGSTPGNIPLSGVLPLIIAFILFVLFGAYFAGAESAFSAVNKIRIKSKADEGNKRAKGVMYVLNRFEKALTTLLVGNNITHIAAASVATVIATRIFSAKGTDTTTFQFSLLCTVVSTAIVFLFSEMIPKTLANDRSETMAMLTNGSLRFFMKVLTPFSAFFGMISKGVSKLFAKEEQPSITEEELGDIINTAEEEGVVDEEQGDMLKSVLEFDDTKIRDIMTMAKDVEAIPLNASEDEVVAAIRATNHSRIPVYSGTPDHIVGTVRIRQYLIEYNRRRPVKLRQVLAAPYFVREDALTDNVLNDMRQHKHHMAIVTDEDGKMVGIVTVEDLLEELVGEIFDEEDVVDRNFQSLGGNHYMVNTRLPLGVVYERMGLPKPPAQYEKKSLLTFLRERTEHLPGEGEVFLYENMEFTVEAVDNGRPVKVDIHILDEEDMAERRAAAEKEAEQ